jgi:hypothetical protein
MERQWNDIDGGKTEGLGGKVLVLFATLSTTNSTWTALGENLDLLGEKPATNCLCYDVASLLCLSVSVSSILHQKWNVWYYLRYRNI